MPSSRDPSCNSGTYAFTQKLYFKCPLEARLHTASVSGTSATWTPQHLVLKVTHVFGYRGRGEHAKLLGDNVVCRRMGKWRYMRGGNKLHAPAILPSEKQSKVSTESEAGWVVWMVCCTIWSTENSLAVPQNEPSRTVAVPTCPGSERNICT